MALWPADSAGGVPDQRRLLQRSDLYWKSRGMIGDGGCDGDALPCAETLDAANTHGRSDVEPPLESPAEEVARLRDSLNDLRGSWLCLPYGRVASCLEL